MAIIGSLLQNIDATLVDVIVLMASQLFVELATSTKQTKLLYSITIFTLSSESALGQRFT